MHQLLDTKFLLGSNPSPAGHHLCLSLTLNAHVDISSGFQEGGNYLANKMMIGIAIGVAIVAIFIIFKVLHSSRTNIPGPIALPIIGKYFLFIYSTKARM